MNDFVFQNTTKIYFGRNQLQNLGTEIKQFGSKVLLAYGGGSIKKNGLYDKVMAELKKASMTVFELSGVEPNPHHTTVNKGAEMCRKENINVVLAVGGGSTIDCAKAVAATAYSKSGNSWDLVIGKEPVTNALPIMTVLTIAATGSEMDAGAVISNVDTQEKLGLIHHLLQPKVSFLDPTNTFTVTAYQTASGSADIMSHIFDTLYFASDERLDMSYRMMDELLKTVVKYAPIAIARPDDYEARANLMWASSWGLNGFLSCGVMQAPTCHRIEHELSAVYDITHGHGLAIVTPRWLEYILTPETAPQIKRLGVKVFDVDASLSDIDGASEAIKRLSDFFFKTLGLKSRLSDLGIDDSKFALMARKACGKNGVIKGFATLKPDDVEKILRVCL
ncbi:MAG: iron-containing alcohol dehydrogenase [Synergistaceae bacterium]|nr:iron-containing alcohol dehydrogenase [Synergistaceae bacterium]